VAQLAGLPRPVLSRAQDILTELESGVGEGRPRAAGTGVRRPRRELPAEQLALFAAMPALLEELQKLDISSMTPLEALNKLYELQQKAKER